MILITGASGNVGREVLQQIAQTGAKVRAAFQSSSKAAAPSGVETVIVDYNQPETLRAALQGVDRVFLVGLPTAQLVTLEHKAVDVIAQAKVRGLVKLSAMGGREAIFPRQHAESEDFIKSTGVPYTFRDPTDLCRISSITRLRRSTRRMRSMEATATAGSARLMFAMWLRWRSKFSPMMATWARRTP